MMIVLRKNLSACAQLQLFMKLVSVPFLINHFQALTVVPSQGYDSLPISTPFHSLESSIYFLSLQLYSMGNQTKKEESSNNYFNEQIEILKWRANAEYNTHIARTFFVTSSNFRTESFQKVITTQLSNKKYIDLTKLRQRPLQDEELGRQQQILQFQDYFSSLDILENVLTMEENLYVLFTLLFGYEQIYKKIAKACVHPSCCFLTTSGDVRAWINRDPVSSLLDQELINQVQKNRKLWGKENQTVLCLTEGSICRNILKLCLQLSDKSTSFLSFYREIATFMNKNMLQNMNFSSLRTFINGYIFQNSIHISNNIASALQRVHLDDSQVSGSTSRMSVTSKSTSRHKQTPSYPLSIKSSRMDMPYQERHSISNQQFNRHQYTPESHFQTHLQLSSSESCASSKQAPKVSTKYIQTSRIKECEWFNQYASTHATPKSNNVSTNQLIFSETNFVKEGKLFVAGKIQSKKDIKDKQNYVSKLNKKIEEGEYSNNKSLVINNIPKKCKKLVRFHSLNPSFIKDCDTDSINIEPIPEQEIDQTNHSNLFNNKTKHRIFFNYEQQNDSKPSSDFSNQSGNMKNGLESRTLTRMVSCLVSNNELDVCQSVGSFQSLQNSQDSGYSGILMGMGRSVQIPNQPSKNRFFSNPSTFSTFPHMTL